MLALACAPARPSDPDLVRPSPGQPILEKLPGPMLGPFESYSDALLAACGRILTKPHASAGRADNQEASTFWRVSSEYCAWVYYTPDDQYMVSKLTDQSAVDPLHRLKTCLLPSTVEDSRYPPNSIKYIYALHNHPFGSSLSRGDIRFIVEQGSAHGFEARTKDGVVRLSIVAFFANDLSKPACDGFHQYVPVTGHIMKWTRERNRWSCEQTAHVSWNEDATDFTLRATRSPCFEKAR
ncbi:hypothetical protein FJV41_14660 [Myxococcus llanfairpwllgwyngyllgogerychwyrndrobwllllantysiliogogogochensis]|uniref:Uncharacterized protein n=2 Tax=Myxococcus llanfairpwllgwyngyllgogerychwyrndrobwllllantysiliogogogochensis TaxID=2590453 RepID=A0A540X1W7_9BACT|nr:hypothetical protein FJV41_14660 [Myxococcus llanfairpwllgwyngyllgogerychwyrndrobwllllantysiliogogogochensis]